MKKKNKGYYQDINYHYKNNNYYNNKKNRYNNYHKEEAYEISSEPPKEKVNPVIINENENEKENEKENENINSFLFFPGENYIPFSNNYTNFNKFIFHYNNKGNFQPLKPLIIYYNENNLLNYDSNNINYKTFSKIYIPKTDDYIIGIITNKFNDFYKVEINSYTQALLYKINTDGNKNSKLNCEIGDIIYGKILNSNNNNNINDILLTTENKNNKDFNKFGKIEKGKNLFLGINKIKNLKKNDFFKKLIIATKSKVYYGDNGYILVDNDADEKFYNLVKIVRDYKNNNKLNEEEIKKKLGIL
jgi:exosome complex RNA-binding protein Rrp4